MHCLVPLARLSVPVTGEVFKGTETDNFIDLPEAWARLNAQEMETSPACPAAKVKTGCQDEPDSCKSESGNARAKSGARLWLLWGSLER